MSDPITRDEARRLACLVQSKPTVANRYDAAADRLARYVLDSRETVEQARERFERWWKKDCRRRKAVARLQHSASGKGYAFPDANLAWHAWLNALEVEPS